MGLKRPAKTLAALVLAAMLTASPHGQTTFARAPRWYQHIFVIVLENHGYEHVIGNRHAPRLNALARGYGLATHYYAVTHPSEPNYIAIIGGSSFGIAGDANYNTTVHGVSYTLTAHSLADQLEAAGLTWKSYQQSLPHAGYTGVAYPDSSAPLYVSRHDPFLNFASIQRNPASLRNIVPDTQLAIDLRRGDVPNFSFIAPDLCHDMHGQWPQCPSAHRPGDANDNRLISQSDAYVGKLVRAIVGARMWARGNNAIIITWDEDDYGIHEVKGMTGCCGALPGGGHVATIVITSHGQRGVRDSTYYNHYALLRTIEVAFHLGCLQHTCDKTSVRIMYPLFKIAQHRQ